MEFFTLNSSLTSIRSANKIIYIPFKIELGYTFLLNVSII
jgi:hypothetical protein